MLQLLTKSLTFGILNGNPSSFPNKIVVTHKRQPPLKMANYLGKGETPMIKLAKTYDSRLIEQNWRELWDKDKIYEFNPNSNKPVFSVDTPPPYVSADHLHIGHAMSYIQAEIIVRHRRMMGFNVFYPMGFDDNGLPTERYVEKKYKLDKRKMSRTDFIALCIEETRKGAKNYREIWERLGIGVDWSLSYNTIGPLAQRIAQRSFLDLYEQGLIYRQQAPNIWCPSCQTAIAQADLDDLEVTGDLHYIRFLLPDGNPIDVATTRPEMLPACVSLYVNPKDSRYINLIGQEVKIPIFGHSVKIRSHADVDPNFGSGVMMVCTWGDSADVTKWREDHLDSRVLVDQRGRLTDIGQHLAGLTITKARQQIVGELRDNSHLIKTIAVIQHKNIHERCKTPAEFNLSWQWHINVLRFKDEWLNRCEELDWHPQFMKERLRDWIIGLKWDWCISRDRYYGVPIPVWYCNDCGQMIVADDKSLPLPVDPREIDPPNITCPNCGTASFQPELQVLDTWMTSSLTPLINARWKEEITLMDKIYPMNLRIQAFEIIRTWLFYSIAKSHFHTDSLPWKSAMISGWGLDQSGKKMSKSEGNVVQIDAMVDKYSADAVRWWSTNVGLGQNLRFIETDLRAGKKMTTKLWNVARFCQPFLEKEEAPILTTFSDKWIVAELQEVIEICSYELNAFDFNKARVCLDKFFWQKFCDTYLELCKNRSWNPEKYSPEELASLRFTIRYSLSTLLKLFAPFIPFVTEEINNLLFNNSQSIHCQNWPRVDKHFRNKSLAEEGDELIEIINRIRHFKTNFTPTYRSEIRRLSLKTANKALVEAAEDLRILANARELEINGEKVDGEHYTTKSCEIILAL